MEAMVKGKKETPEKFPNIITCPNEVSYPGNEGKLLYSSLADGGHVHG